MPSKENIEFPRSAADKIVKIAKTRYFIITPIMHSIRKIYYATNSYLLYSLTKKLCFYCLSIGSWE